MPNLQQLILLERDKSPKFVAEKLEYLMQSKEAAMFAATLVKSQIPQYTGNLNHMWLFWENVQKCLYPEKNTIEYHNIVQSVFSE